MSDNDDLFQEMTEQEKQQAEELKQQQASEAQKKKKVVVGRTLFSFEIKVYEQETDLDKLAETIKSMEFQGAQIYKEHKIEPIAFGMNKLIINIMAQDDKFISDDFIDRVEEIEDVQSVDTLQMQKM